MICAIRVVAVRIGPTVFCVGDGLGEQAGAMEVHVRVQMLAAEGVDERCEALRDMAVAEVFSHNRAVFGLDQCVVVAVPRARFGKFLDQQLVEQLGDVAVDVL